MNWKNFLLGAGAGVIAGYYASEALKKNSMASGEKVLQTVKEAFKDSGSIEGSWIKFRPENYEKHAVKTQVYRGGITTNEDGETKQYEFLADANTGTVIDVYPITYA
ncbi:hypothetical protein D4T97_006690 [Siminovitchia acidinfaciens]|uniref:PepSY domain-containing protein n=1 Tax=Siminovitchia acidinfaciens TaxID=2321395 RepID=A0A429Y4T6_9BACI|nr:PepSY domain-containing protein [Siminovitchia acidinfaciens]RST76445.1 hypothetical protein D4T97_006690 [Siminovitchia acidinfaciens]